MSKSQFKDVFGSWHKIPKSKKKEFVDVQFDRVKNSNISLTKLNLANNVVNDAINSKKKRGPYREYTPQFKEERIIEYKNGASRSRICLRYGISPSTFDSWLKIYNTRMKLVKDGKSWKNENNFNRKNKNKSKSKSKTNTNNNNNGKNKENSNNNNKDDEKEIDLIMEKQSGRPIKMTKQSKTELLCYVRALRETGAEINKNVISALLKVFAPKYLIDNGTIDTNSRGLIQYIYYELDYVRRAKTTARKQRSAEEIEEATKEFWKKMHRVFEETEAMSSSSKFIFW